MLLPTIRRLDAGNALLAGTRLYDVEPTAVDTPTDQDLEAEVLAEEERREMEADLAKNERGVATQLEEEEEAAAAMAHLQEQHKAASYREWEDWAVADEAGKTSKRARCTMTVTATVSTCIGLCILLVKSGYGKCGS